MEINYLAVIAAAVAALVISGVWYGVLGGQLAALHEAYAVSGPPSVRDVLVELVRNLLVAAVVAGLADQVGVGGWAQGAVLGVALWIGFPVVVLAGSVYHEKVPVRLAAIHAGDWLLKLVAVSTIVGVWR
jgi:Protein of unknown function (DUF1761)